MAQGTSGSGLYVIDSMPFPDELGTSYVTFPVAYGDVTGGYHVRVVSVTSNTQINIPEEGISTTLDQGDHVEFDYTPTDGATRITCSNPCLATQYVKRNLAGDTDEDTGAFMTPLTPDSSFETEVFFSPPDLTWEDSALTTLSIIVSEYPVSYLYLNGNSLTSLDWQEIQAGSKWYATTPITEEFNHLYSNDPSPDGRYSIKACFLDHFARGWECTVYMNQYI